MLYCAIAVAITTALSFVFVRHVFDFLLSRAAPDITFIYTRVTEMLSTYIEVAIYCGLALALPLITYQAIMFILPALTRSERRHLFWLLSGVVVCFISGVAFTYFILLPPMLNFLLAFGSDIAQPMISIGNYVSVVVRLIFWIGIVFEIPIVMYFLSRLGIVSPEWLLKNWRWSFIVAFALGAVITPTMDPLNQTLVASPIVLLYFIGILLARLARRGREERQLAPVALEEE